MRSKKRPKINRYIAVWKCPSHEFSELLDNAGGPLPKAEVPNYAAYLKMLRDTLATGIHDADNAFYILMPMAEMREQVQRRGLPWNDGSWAIVAGEVLDRIDRDAKRSYAAGKMPDLEERMTPAWDRVNGWWS